MRLVSVLALAALTATAARSQPIYAVMVADADTSVATVLRALDASAESAGLTPIPDSTVGARRTMRGADGTVRVVLLPLPGHRTRVVVTTQAHPDAFRAIWHRWRDSTSARLPVRPDSSTWLPAAYVPLWDDGSPGACTSPRVSDTDPSMPTPPEKRSGRDPRYPRTVQQRGLGARVLMYTHLSAEGRVRCIQGAVLSYKEVNDEVVDAVRTWRFEPARLRGEPSPSAIMIPVRFRAE